MRFSTGIVFLFVLIASGCGSYAEFTLPASGGDASPASVVWEVAPEPVLARGSPGEWDGVDVLNPSVVRRGGSYFNFYSGYDGRTWRTGLATSEDGTHWDKVGAVLAPDDATWEGGYIAANGTAVAVGEEFLCWYQAGDPPRIGLATSSDGTSWRRLPQPVLDAGPRGSWDERAVADPYVLAEGGRYYMYYLGEDRARRQRLGVAVSEDGIQWIKLRGNPVLELGEPGSFDEAGLGEPAVWEWDGAYWMAYTGRDRREYRRLGLAVSVNGVDWERLPANTVLQGDRAWNDKVVCDPSVEVLGEEVRVWFGGGDVAHPAENVNGQIGLASLRRESANLAE